MSNKLISWKYQLTTYFLEISTNNLFLGNIIVLTNLIYVLFYTGITTVKSPTNKNGAPPTGKTNQELISWKYQLTTYFLEISTNNLFLGNIIVLTNLSYLRFILYRYNTCEINYQ